ncbi:MAG: lipoate--protein ligase family protein [Thermoguttaceae bacterium]|jgi:lipoate-protein ligase A
MRYLDLTLPTPAENLALDEALLEEAEAAGRPTETLRFWEAPSPAVVVGRSSRLAAEVQGDVCRSLRIPVLRRPSGGAAVVIGPGCLMYALVLSYRRRPALRAVDQAHRTVLGTICAALAQRVPGLRCEGTSDLALGGRKVSGNSLRAKREHLLYHGTLLYGFPLALLARCLAMPPRQPTYRCGRSHEAFVANLPIGPAVIRESLLAAWGALEPCGEWPRGLAAGLAAHRYNSAAWNEQF